MCCLLFLVLCCCIRCLKNIVCAGSFYCELYEKFNGFLCVLSKSLSSLVVPSLWLMRITDREIKHKWTDDIKRGNRTRKSTLLSFLFVLLVLFNNFCKECDELYTSSEAHESQTIRFSVTILFFKQFNHLTNLSIH